MTGGNLNLLKNADSESLPGSIYPLTGLLTTRRPEWTNIDLAKKGYSVTFKFIGDRILLSIPRGKSGEHGMEKRMREWASVFEAMPCGGLLP